MVATWDSQFSCATWSTRPRRRQRRESEATVAVPSSLAEVALVQRPVVPRPGESMRKRVLRTRSSGVGRRRFRY